MITLQINWESFLAMHMVLLLSQKFLTVKNSLIELYKLEIHGGLLNGKETGVINLQNGLLKPKNKLDLQKKMMVAFGFLWKIISRFMICFVFAKLMTHLISQALQSLISVNQNLMNLSKWRLIKPEDTLLHFLKGTKDVMLESQVINISPTGLLWQKQ